VPLGSRTRCAEHCADRQRKHSEERRTTEGKIGPESSHRFAFAARLSINREDCEQEMYRAQGWLYIPAAPCASTDVLAWPGWKVLVCCAVGVPLTALRVLRKPEYHDYADGLHCRHGNSIPRHTLADTACGFNANADMAAEELQRGTNRYLHRRLIPANSTWRSNFTVHDRDIMTLKISVA